MDDIDRSIVRLLVKARAASPLALQDLIDRIRAVAGVTATTTTLALSSLHHEPAAATPTHG